MLHWAPVREAFGHVPRFRVAEVRASHVRGV